MPRVTLALPREDRTPVVGRPNSRVFHLVREGELDLFGEALCGIFGRQRMLTVRRVGFGGAVLRTRLCRRCRRVAIATGSEETAAREAEAMLAADAFWGDAPWGHS